MNMSPTETTGEGITGSCWCIILLLVRNTTGDAAVMPIAEEQGDEANWENEDMKEVDPLLEYNVYQEAKVGNWMGSAGFLSKVFPIPKFG